MISASAVQESEMVTHFHRLHPIPIEFLDSFVEHRLWHALVRETVSVTYEGFACCGLSIELAFAEGHPTAGIVKT